MGGTYSWVAAVILVGHAAAYTSPSMARLNGRTPSVRMGPEDNGKKSFKLSGVVKSTALHVKSERQKQRVAIHNAIIRHKARYNELRVEGYPEPNVIDVYVHAAGSDKFWYVGKSCARNGVGGVDGPALSVVLQRRLALEHAKLLQPDELGRAQKLEVWCAPLNGGLEEDLLAALGNAQRQQSLRTLKLDAEVDGFTALLDAEAEACGSVTPTTMTIQDCGFFPEHYTPSLGSDTTGPVTGNQPGYCVKLRPDGQFPLNCPWLCMVAREDFGI